jgi:hypothetical protein
VLRGRSGRRRQHEVSRAATRSIVATQLPARADAAPFVGPAAGAALGTPTVTGVTPAAIRSGRVYVCCGGWRAAVRSAWNGPRSSA